mmetsp:Transcript_8179/g.10709  ORF Transcript_8179/g.10709 Transcript_8179/m.10709 type:complete len:118 (+) Transcript_8179:312-665(+)
MISELFIQKVCSLLIGQLCSQKSVKSSMSGLRKALGLSFKMMMMARKVSTKCPMKKTQLLVMAVMMMKKNLKVISQKPVMIKAVVLEAKIYQRKVSHGTNLTSKQKKKTEEQQLEKL